MTGIKESGVRRGKKEIDTPRSKDLTVYTQVE